MLTQIVAMAFAATAQTSPAASAVQPHTQHVQSGPAGHSQMRHSSMAEHGNGCCSKSADGKMQCQMMSRHGGQHQGAADHQPQQGHGTPN